MNFMVALLWSSLLNLGLYLYWLYLFSWLWHLDTVEISGGCWWRWKSWLGWNTGQRTCWQVQPRRGQAPCRRCLQVFAQSPKETAFGIRSNAVHFKNKTRASHQWEQHAFTSRWCFWTSGEDRSSTDRAEQDSQPSRLLFPKNTTWRGCRAGGM